jgi:hypothetical protein
LRTLPEQLGAPITAAYAHVRIEIEDRVAGELDVVSNESGIKIER